VSSSPTDPYELRITPEGFRHLNGLPTKIREAALAALHGTIRENPHRLGKALVGELAALFSARRGDYRIIYSIDDAARILIVHRIQHRASVYRRR
jgi:mRNA interferase RelE/StbE